VVTIIGILAGVAVPKFQTFKARAQQTEAKSGLNGVYLAQQAYMANYSDFAPVAAAFGNLYTTAGVKGAAANTIGFAISGTRPKYSYSIVSEAETNAQAARWAAMAVSNAPLGTNGADVKVFDAQRINTNKWACSAYDGVAGIPATAPAAGAKLATTATQCPQQGTGTANFAVAISDSDDPE
ncbi:MAG: hypothetical protein IOD12_17595, partial [Silvanigrellales bacterium]|nr:hypothetical protein [Silvanigrellales bacterium]